MEAYGSRETRSVTKNKIFFRDKMRLNNINEMFSVFEEKLRSQKELLKSVQDIIKTLRDN